MIEAEEELDCVPLEARPTGGKLEIPEIGIMVAVDSKELSVTQEFTDDEGERFLTIVQGLALLADKHFEPNGIHSNGFACESFQPMGSVPAALKESLNLGSDFHVHLSRIVGMPPAFKSLDYNFISGKSELHVTAAPVTFEKRTATKYAAGLRANDLQRKQIDRQNAKSDRTNLKADHALLMMVDLIESDPPPNTLKEHFERLMVIDGALKRSELKPPLKK